MFADQAAFINADPDQAALKMWILINLLLKNGSGSRKIIGTVPYEEFSVVEKTEKISQK